MLNRPALARVEQDYLGVCGCDHIFKFNCVSQVFFCRDIWQRQTTICFCNLYIFKISIKLLGKKHFLISLILFLLIIRVMRLLHNTSSRLHASLSYKSCNYLQFCKFYALTEVKYLPDTGTVINNLKLIFSILFYTLIGLAPISHQVI